MVTNAAWVSAEIASTSGSIQRSSERKPGVRCQPKEPLGDGEPLVDRCRDTFLAQTQADHWAPMLLEQRQDGVDAALLAAYGVDERYLATVLDGRFNAGLECLRIRRVHHQPSISDTAHGSNDPKHVVDFLAAGHPRVDVEDVRAGCNLFQSQGRDERGVTSRDRRPDLRSRPVDRLTYEQHLAVTSRSVVSVLVVSHAQRRCERILCLCKPPAPDDLVRQPAQSREVVTWGVGVASTVVARYSARAHIPPEPVQIVTLGGRSEHRSGDRPSVKCRVSGI